MAKTLILERIIQVARTGIHPATTKTATLTYPLAGYHDVLVQYFEATGNAVAQLSIVKQ